MRCTILLARENCWPSMCFLHFVPKRRSRPSTPPKGSGVLPMPWNSLYMSQRLTYLGDMEKRLALSRESAATGGLAVAVSSSAPMSCASSSSPDSNVRFRAWAGGCLDICARALGEMASDSHLRMPLVRWRKIYRLRSPFECDRAVVG